MSCRRLVTRFTPQINSAYKGIIYCGPQIRKIHEMQTPESIAQKTRRPLSPYLSIYQPQLTWLMSIAHRMTGGALATVVYGFGLYYAVAQPGVISESLNMAVAELPGALVTSGKLLLSAPLWYHTFNGIRHLVWDLGYALSLRGSYAGGYAVNGLTIIMSIWSALF